MAVKLRLMRMGKKKQPTYRVVAADARSPRDGRFIEIVGTYEPRREPSVIRIDNEKAVKWLRNGAQPTETVQKLLKTSGAWDWFTTGQEPAQIARFWEVCQLPDFQKTALDEHLRLARGVFEALTGPGGRLTDDWIAPRFAAADRVGGEIDQLSARLSAVRTLAYVAHRPDWLRGAAEWREKTRALEERLSDALHERLTARFVDRRTSVLMRALHVRDDVLADVVDAIAPVPGRAPPRFCCMSRNARPMLAPAGRCGSDRSRSGLPWCSPPWPVSRTRRSVACADVTEQGSTCPR